MTTQGSTRQYVTVTIAEQLFGIPVLQVHDVLQGERINTIPLAPPEIAGSLNLRGRIVTAINMRTKLGLAARNDSDIAAEDAMSIVVDHQGEMYSLMVDNVGDVLDLEDHLFEKPPSTMHPRWRSIASGIYQLENELLLLLDIGRLFEQEQSPVETNIAA